MSKSEKLVQIPGFNLAPKPISPTSGKSYRPTFCPKQPADWDHWKLMPNVELWKAVCLSLDIEPEEPNEMRLWLNNPSGSPLPYPAEFGYRFAVLSANAIEYGLIQEQSATYHDGAHPFSLVMLGAVADAAISFGWTIPEKLVEVLFQGSAQKNPYKREDLIKKWHKSDAFRIFASGRKDEGLVPIKGFIYGICKLLKGEKEGTTGTPLDTLAQAISVAYCAENDGEQGEFNIRNFTWEKLRESPEPLKLYPKAKVGDRDDVLRGGFIGQGFAADIENYFIVERRIKERLKNACADELKAQRYTLREAAAQLALWTKMTRIRWEIILAEFVSSGDLRLRQPTNFRDDAIYQCTGEVLPWFEQCKVEDLDALLDSGKTGQKLIQRFGLIPTSREATSPASVVESVCQSLSQPTKYPLLSKSQMIAAFRTLFQGVTGVPSELRFIKMLGDPPKWMKEARVQKGLKGDRKASAMWDPVVFASAVYDQYKLLRPRLSRLFSECQDLLPWADKWGERKRELEP